jgi:hypothetical protein
VREAVKADGGWRMAVGDGGEAVGGMDAGRVVLTVVFLIR